MLFSRLVVFWVLVWGFFGWMCFWVWLLSLINFVLLLGFGGLYILEICWVRVFWIGLEFRLGGSLWVVGSC